MEAKTGEKSKITTCLGHIGGFCIVISPLAGLFGFPLRHFKH